MSEGAKIYDLDQVAVSFAAQDVSSGYGDGAAISLEKMKPTFTEKEGADGSVARSKTGSKLWKVTITLLSTSSANAILSAIHELDQDNPNGAGVGPLFITDLQGTTLFTSDKAWIVTMPKLDLNAEASNVEWELRAANATAFWGGN
jgi:hypothetical protein